MGEWSNELFGCFSNMGVCVMTWIFPCVTAGNNAEAVGKSCCLWGCLGVLGPIGIYTRAVVRGEIRKQKDIEGTFGNDCLMHWFCALCSLVQEANELSGGAQTQSMARE